MDLFSLGYFRMSFLTAVCAVGAPVMLLAQTHPTPRGTKATEHAATPVAPVSVRFWKTDLPSFGELRLTLVPANPKGRLEAHEVGSEGPGYQFGNYLEVSPGRCALELSEVSASAVGKPLPPLANVPTDFSAGAFYTVLASEGAKVGDAPRLEVIEDRRADEKLTAGSAQLTIRSFVPSLKETRVVVGEALSAQFVAGTGFLVMRGVQPAVYQVKTSGKDATGKPFEWSTETDLRQFHRQTLLICPDPYGRIRPRLSVDGELPPVPLSGDEQR